MTEIIAPLDGIVKYAIRCALSGEHDKWRALPFNGVWRYQLDNLTRADSGGLQLVQRALSFLIDQQTLSEINLIDTSVPPPIQEPPPAPLPDHDVPDLPKACRLTRAQERQADEVGQFERDYVAWASTMANETPVTYEQLLGIALLGVAIGRRCYLRAPWGKRIFPNHFGIILGTTTYNHKSTALDLMTLIVEEAFPHLLMPRPQSTENFGNMLAGRWETDGLSPEDKAELERARPFAGQRLIVRDEISGLFRSFGRDYMAGMREDLLTMYDGHTSYKVSSNARGIVIAREIAPHLIGATTPAGLSASISRRDWEDGNLARFALITPEPHYKDRPTPEAFVHPEQFITHLKGLHEKLPAPPHFSSTGKAETWSLVADIWPESTAYHNALREMTNPERTDSLDNRLRGTYGRHNEKTLKIALCLAVMDWYKNSLGNSLVNPHPVVSKPHWYRAQQIAEGWRASAHRFLRMVSASDDVESNDRVYKQLGKWPDGETKTELLERTGLSKNALEASLETLMESGKVEVFKRKSTRGPEAHVYRVCG